ncbi:immunity 41 family protein [Niabella sp. CC-SYL272]|uniref:immunity 41 family protein n=1 Tax=Niabella agricola TaxID=2891571 RepID=UPI001F3C2125|nr:immunity 41 family protein [Niabella agricola]MCF3107444.1 immunity 41 family protein [Niabella agricola]
MNPILEQYLEYLESEHEFSYKLRMERAWDDQEYEKCIRLLLEVIESYRHSPLIPKSVVLFFTGMSHLIGQISNPAFFANRDPAYQELVEKRKKELLTLQEQFYSGALFNA